MIGPGWLGSGLAVVMLAIAAFCAVRLVVWRLRDRAAEPEADLLHVLMGTCMAGMFEAKLSVLPATTWLAVFIAATSWFAWRAIRVRRKHLRPRWQCPHPAPHAMESAAMLYMLWPAGPVGHPTSMPGMRGPASNPALALVLALFMVGYILWTTDQLTTRSRIRATDAITNPALAPRLTACSKIVMSAAMGYMLLTML